MKLLSAECESKSECDGNFFVARVKQILFKNKILFVSQNIFIIGIEIKNLSTKFYN